MKKYNHRLPIWLQAIGVLILLAVFTFAVFIYNSTRDSEVLIILISSLFIVTLCIGSFLFLSQSISIAEKGIFIKYFPIYKIFIPFNEITEVKILQTFSPFKDAGGIGLRKAPGKIVFANATGHAVEILTQEATYVYSFRKSEDGPQEILSEFLKNRDS